MVALVAGLGFGAVLAAAAGARRTLSAPHRLYEERLMQDVALYGTPDIDGRSVEPRTGLGVRSRGRVGGRASDRVSARAAAVGLDR